MSESSVMKCAAVAISVLTVFGGVRKTFGTEFSGIAGAYILNPKMNWKSQKTENSQRSEILDGTTVYFTKRFEARLKVHTAPVATSAVKAIARAELSAVRNLYVPRKTPYAGEVSSWIECDENLKPREFKFHFDGEEINGLVAGVSRRLVFGACAKGQVAHLGAFFILFDSVAKKIIEVRLFDLESRPEKGSEQAVRALIAAATDLLIRRR